jgi:hypothetical protein
MPRPRVAGDPVDVLTPCGHHQHLAELLAIGVQSDGGTRGTQVTAVGVWLLGMARARRRRQGWDPRVR